MKIGSDQIYSDAEILIIHAAAPMDWQIREFCKVPILFQGRKYYLRSKRKTEQPRKMVYELCPWPPDLHNASRSMMKNTLLRATERPQKTGAMTGSIWRSSLSIPFGPLLVRV